jgi:outer membrane immunogenic protein
MKNCSLTASVALALSAGSVLAADLPSRKSPPPAMLLPAPLWSGLYVGLNAGGSWSDSNSIPNAATPLFANGVIVAVPAQGLARLATGRAFARDQSGFIGGGQIGYNFEFGNRFVAGVETDLQGLTHSGGAQTSSLGVTEAMVVRTTLTSEKSLDYLGTARGRLGWLPTPTLLLYGTGGLAYGGVNASTAIRQFNFGNGVLGMGRERFSDTRVGWTAGAGVEWLFLPNWSAKAEYLRYDLSSVTYSGALFTVAPPTTYAISRATTRFDGNVVRAGLNYHFNWAAGLGPIRAIY